MWPFEQVKRFVKRAIQRREEVQPWHALRYLLACYLVGEKTLSEELDEFFAAERTTNNATLVLAELKELILTRQESEKDLEGLQREFHCQYDLGTSTRFFRYIHAYLSAKATSGDVSPDQAKLVTDVRVLKDNVQNERNRVFLLGHSDVKLLEKGQKLGDLDEKLVRLLMGFEGTLRKVEWADALVRSGQLTDPELVSVLMKEVRQEMEQLSERQKAVDKELLELLKPPGF